MKLNSLFATAALIALFSSCAKEVQDEQLSNKNAISEISASYADVDGSKTVLGNDGQSILWSPNDEISVFYNSTGVKFTAINTKPVDQTMFVSDKAIIYGGTEGYLKSYLYAVYPYSPDNKQDGEVTTLIVPATQVAIEGSFARGAFPSVGRSKNTDIAFYNVCGGIAFTVSQTGIQTIVFKGKNNEVIAGKVKVQFNSDGKPVVSQVVSGSSEVTVTAPEGGFQTGTPYYISLLPVQFNNGFELRFDKAATAATFSTAASAEVKRSIFAKLENKDAGLEWKSTVATDLSASGTANCYIVSQAGYYKFDATVKGNSTESVGTSAKAEVLWESFGTSTAPSKGDVINNALELKDGYVQFSTPSTLNNGNAVIAVKDASDNILWSWHIWVCKDFNPRATAHVYNNDAGTMMDRNLGATSATKGDVHALGLLYQWGRKDPFMGSSSISSNSVAASTLSWSSAVSSDSSNGTIEYAVAHPTTFITQNSNNYDWYYTGTSSTDNTRWTSTKTMYDPCPAGWRVPDGGSNGVWSKAFGYSSYWETSSNWDSTNKGMNFGSTDKTLGSGAIWFPAFGDRRSSDGSLINVGSIGFYWSCTTYSSYAYFLYFDLNGIVEPAGSTYRAMGQSVRCLSE